MFSFLRRGNQENALQGEDTASSVLRRELFEQILEKDGPGSDLGASLRTLRQIVAENPGNAEVSDTAGEIAGTLAKAHALSTARFARVR